QLFIICYSAVTSAIYTLSLHDALPIWQGFVGRNVFRPLHPFGRHLESPRNHQRHGKPQRDEHDEGLRDPVRCVKRRENAGADLEDRKSTRLNSSHLGTSYAVFCLKKKT